MLQLIISTNLFVPNNIIVVVDDSLNSKTSQVLSEYTWDNLKFISRKQKLGRGSAVLVGMEEHMQYKFDYLLEMDADFSHNPSEITNLILAIKIENSDLVIASRYLKGSKISNWPIRRRIFSKIANKLCAIVLKSNINDHTNGIRIYSRRAIELILNECGKISDGFILLSEIIA
jgi:dolichol-phosphate mannosyltransferase